MTYDIAGARASVPDPAATVQRAQAWAAERGGQVLLADASVVFGRDHLESAVRHALRAQAAGAGAARDLGLETLRYLCARRQVADAIRAGGLKTTTRAIGVVVFAGSAAALISEMGWARDDEVLAPAGKSLRALGIEPGEERTVPAGRTTDLALERTALVDIEK